MRWVKVNETIYWMFCAMHIAYASQWLCVLSTRIQMNHKKLSLPVYVASVYYSHNRVNSWCPPETHFCTEFKFKFIHSDCFYECTIYWLLIQLLFIRENFIRTNSHCDFSLSVLIFFILFSDFPVRCGGRIQRPKQNCKENWVWIENDGIEIEKPLVWSNPSNKHFLFVPNQTNAGGKIWNENQSSNFNGSTVIRKCSG